jgi:histidinol phosphatase-like enzyme (inositol monophosphatase family)
MNFEHELETAKRAARCAGELALGYWNKGIQAESKADDSPVTIADRENERLIAGLFEEAFPEDGLLGEEGCNKASRSGRRWIIDPIDGTRDFVRGNRMWAILLALEAAGKIVVGVCHFPALAEMYAAADGGGAYLNDERIQVSAIGARSEAVLCLNDFDRLNRCHFSGELLDWAAGFWAVRSMGGAPDSMLVASGKADAWLEPSAKAWDLAPIKILTEEAGGRFFNFDGGSSIYAGNCATSNAAIEAELRRFAVR